METRYQGNSGTTQKLAEDLKTVAQDVEELIKAGGAEMSEKAREIQEHLHQALEVAQATAQELQAQTAAQVRAVDRVIRQNPYESIGVAFGAGLLIGLIFTRK
jgi:ElaB/YqjD/DUF883 family membrane-anchored ribosome-binding protein